MIRIHLLVHHQLILLHILDCLLILGAFKNRPLRKTNRKGPKDIWVPKNKIIPLVDILNKSNTTPVMVIGQWMLTIHDKQKVYIPRTPNEERKSTQHGDWWWNT